MNNFTLKHLLITANDGIYLPALYTTGKSKARTLVVYVHGAGSSSIIRSPNLTNTFAKASVDAGYDFLAFNNRGSGYITKFDTSVGSSHLGGMTYERVRDFSKDLEGVKVWSKDHGYREIVLVGHSTGANKIAHALAGSDDEFVLGVALLGGGDDITLQTSRYSPTHLAKIIQTAQEKMKAGKDRDLVPQAQFPGGHPISWGSLVELITEGSDYDIFPFARHKKWNDSFSYVKSLKIPTLFVYGSDDFGTIVPVDESVKFLTDLLPGSTGRVIFGADHNFTDKEEELASTTVGWIKNIES